MRLLKFTSLAIALALAVGGCSAGDSSTDYNLASESTFDEVPLDPTTINAQLSRYKDQTQFLNPLGWYHYDGAAHRASDRSSAGEGSAREMQESDIYKLGPDGSKLLYLLNNYRGLQVVSFADGPDQARLLGRAEPTGNWPHDMYYDAPGNRLVVLERVWYDASGTYASYQSPTSRLLVYDVSDSTSPALAQTLEIPGALAESRMVGDVLYVATRVAPSREGDTGIGRVFSYELTAEGVEQVTSHELTLPISARENMNIVEVKTDNGYEYYLVAILSTSHFGWWDRQSTIEVVDISDPDGVMSPVLIAETKGSVWERSQTAIKDRTLIATSNYTAESGLQRIAVETFTFPEEDSEVLTAEEAEYRRIHAERELRLRREELVRSGVSGEDLADALAAYKDELMRDADLGLAGRFVAEGLNLRKPLADFLTTVGSTQGLSASLQDVRYRGDLLYAFWVPANNIDPLDVFDLSNPREGVPHLSHLEFEGWIQHATPLTYVGEEYVLGLGWVIPAVDNERGRRFPQAMLIKVERDDRGIYPQVMSTWRMPDRGVWSSFNAADKFIDVRMDGDGTGSVLFAFSSWDSGRYTSGGLLLGFDLGDPRHAFSEGSVLEADTGWLRRVFRHEEIDRIHTFADVALGTYDLEGRVGSADRVVAATQVLELARDIQAYVTLDADHGLQIISNYRWDEVDLSTSELRLVRAEFADAEKADVLSSTTMTGRYIDHLVHQGDIYVLSQRWHRIADDDGSFDYSQDYTLTRVGVGADSLEQVAKVTWSQTYYNAPENVSLGFNGQLVRTPAGQILVGAGNGVKALVIGEDSLTLAEMNVENCDFEGVAAGQLQVFDSGLYASYSQVVVDDDRPGLRLARNFIRPVAEAGATTLACGETLNIPGRLLAVTDRGVVTDDDRVIDIIRHEQDNDYVYYEVVSEKVMAALQVGESGAALRDMYDPDDVSVSNMHVDGTTFVFLENEVRDHYWPMYRERLDWPWYPRQTTEQRYVRLRLDDDGEFVRKVWRLDLALEGGANLLGVYSEDGVAVVGVGRQLQVLRLNEEVRPSPLAVQKVNPDGSLGEPTETLTLSSHFWYWRGDQRLDWSPERQSFTLANGLYGVTQFSIAP